MNIQDKAVKVRVRRAELEGQFPSGDCLLVSLESGTFNTVGGNTVEVKVDSAARHLVEGTHRLATDGEIKEFRAKQDEDRKSILSAQLAQPELMREILNRAINQRVPVLAPVNTTK